MVATVATQAVTHQLPHVLQPCGTTGVLQRLAGALIRESKFAREEGLLCKSRAEMVAAAPAEQSTGSTDPPASPGLGPRTSSIRLAPFPDTPSVPGEVPASPASILKGLSWGSETAPVPEPEPDSCSVRDQLSTAQAPEPEAEDQESGASAAEKLKLAKERAAIGPLGTSTEMDMSDLIQAFEAFDLDGNGAIDIEELGNLLRAMALQPNSSIRQLNEDEIARLFEEADLDGDGGIDFEEFVTIASGSLGVDLSAPCMTRCQNTTIAQLWQVHTKGHAATVVLSPIQTFFTVIILAFGWSLESEILAVSVSMVSIVLMMLAVSVGLAGRPAVRWGFGLFGLWELAVTGTCGWMISALAFRECAGGNALAGQPDLLCAFNELLLLACVVTALLGLMLAAAALAVLVDSRHSVKLEFSVNDFKNPWQVAIALAMADNSGAAIQQARARKASGKQRSALGGGGWKAVMVRLPDHAAVLPCSLPRSTLNRAVIARAGSGACRTRTPRGALICTRLQPPPEARKCFGATCRSPPPWFEPLPG